MGHPKPRRAPPTDGDGELRARIRSELECRGVDPAFSEAVAGRLAPTVAKLSPGDLGAVLGTVVAAYCETAPRGESDVRPEDIADIQRLMQGFSEEVQKLDEGLRMLSAYVSRLRKRGARGNLEILH